MEKIKQIICLDLFNAPFGKKMSIFIGILTLFIISIYNSPRLIGSSKSVFPVVTQADGAFYAYRIKSALTGTDPIISCAEDPSLKSTITWMPWVEDNIWTSLIRPFAKTDINRALNITYFVLPPIVFLLLIFSLYQLTGNLFLSVFVSVLGMSTPSFLYWKPFITPSTLNAIVPIESLPFFRFANPLLRSVGTLAAMGAIFCWLKKIETKKNPSTFFSIFVMLLLVLPFFSQFFYWSWLMGTLIGYSTLSLLKREYQIAFRLLVLVIGAFLIGSPQLIRSIHVAKDPLVLEVLHRVGLMLNVRQPFFLWHFGIIGTFIAYQLLAFKNWDWRWKFCTSAVISGWLLLNQNLITGVYNQEHHYFRPLLLLYFCIIADLIRRLLEKIPNFEKIVPVRNFVFVVLLVAACAQGIAMSHRIHKAAWAPGEDIPLANSISRSISKLKNLSIEDRSSALMDPRLSYILGLSADTPVYVHEYTHQCIIPDEELFARWALLGRAYGFSSNQFPNVKALAEPNNLPWWLYGLPTSYTGVKNRNHPKDREQMAAAWYKAYDESNLVDLVTYLTGRHGVPRLAIESPGFELNRSALSKNFRLELLFEVPEEKIRAWKLIANTQI